VKVPEAAPRRDAPAAIGGRSDPREGRRWAIAGAVTWLGLALTYSGTHALRRLAAGLPAFSSWQQAAHASASILVGGLLVPVVVAVLLRLRSRPRPFWVVAVTYIGLGLAFWVGWASLVRVYAGMMGLPAPAGAGAGDPFLPWLVLTALISLTLYTVVALVVEAAWLRNAIRRREVEAARLQGEIDSARAAALRARVDPAFIREATEIASEVMDRSVPEARRVLTNLSELLRVALGRNGAQTVDVRQEMVLARRFIEIQQARYGDAVCVDWDMEEDGLGASVPPLVLQPLLAEAFGWIASRCGAGHIDVSVRAAGERPVFVVQARGRDPGGSGPARVAGPPDVDALRSRLERLDLQQVDWEVGLAGGGGIEIRAAVRPKPREPL
jgi:two-component system, LytTR family, sensor kinase